MAFCCAGLAVVEQIMAEEMTEKAGPKGREVRLDSYAAFNDRDLLSQLAVERMLAGVATVATTEKLAEVLSADLAEHDAAVLMIDGIVFHECRCVVALLITADDTKIPAGVWEGDTENTTVVKRLLADLVARNLRFEQGLLVRHRRGKALAAGTASSAPLVEPLTQRSDNGGTVQHRRKVRL